MTSSAVDRLAASVDRHPQIRARSARSRTLPNRTYSTAVLTVQRKRWRPPRPVPSRVDPGCTGTRFARDLPTRRRRQEQRHRYRERPRRPTGAARKRPPVAPRARAMRARAASSTAGPAREAMRAARTETRQQKQDHGPGLDGRTDLAIAVNAERHRNDARPSRLESRRAAVRRRAAAHSVMSGLVPRTVVARKRHSPTP